MTSQKQIIDFTKQLVRFRTTPDKPEEFTKCMQFILRYLEKSNVPHVMQMHTFNNLPSLVVTSKKTTHPRIVLFGHIDVVPGSASQFTPRVAGNKLYARGALDMKSGVAIMLHVFCDILREQPHADIGLMITSDEEVGGFDGVNQLINTKNYSTDFAISLEGMAKTHIINRQKGVCRIQLTAKGAAAHSAYPWKGKNAIHILTQTLNTLQKHFPTAPDAWKSTLSLNIISTTNTAQNRVPDDAQAIIDIRFTPDKARTPQQMFQRVKKLLPRTVQAELLFGGSMLWTDDFNLYLQQLQCATTQPYRRTLPLGFSHGASDGRFFTEKGIPCVEFGATGAGTHGDKEYLDMRSIPRVYHTLMDFLGTMND